MLTAAVGNPHPQTGAVVITIDGVDPDADPLTYTTTIPAKGAVDGDPLIAQWIYTPTPNARIQAANGSAADKQDTFTITASDGNTDTVMDVTVPVLPPDNTVVATINIGHSPFGAAVSPDGARLYVADRYLSVVDNATNTSIAAIPIGNDGPNAVAASRDGARIYVGYDSGVSAGSPLNPYINTQIVAIVDAATYATIASVDVGVAGGMAESPDGTWLYVTTGIDTAGLHQPREVAVIDTATGTIAKTIPLVGLLAVVASDIAVSPDGTRLFVTALAEDDNYAVAVVDTDAEAVSHVIPVGGRPRGVAPSPDGAHVYIGNFQSNGVTVIDTATNAVTAAIPVYGIPEDVVVSPDGTRVYATSHGNGTVSVIDTAAWLVTATTPISFNATSFNSLAIGPDGRHLYVSTFNDYAVRVVSVLPGDAAYGNAAPTAIAPATVGDPNPDTGEIVGWVYVADDDGDPLHFGVGGPPGKGSITIDSEAGDWTYVPSPDAQIAAAQPNATPADKEDTFTVVAGDGYAHTTVTVTVPISPPNNTVIATIPIPVLGNPINVAFSPDGRHAYVVSTAQDTVSVIDTATYAVTAQIEVGEDPSVVAPTPDGTRAYTSNWGDDTVSVIDTDPVSPTHHQVTKTIAVGHHPNGLAVGLDGTAAYVANNDDGTVCVIDTHPASPTYHQVTATIPVGSVPNGVAVSTRYAYTVGVDNSKLAAINTTSHAVSVFPYIGGGSDYVALGYHGPAALNRIYISAAGGNKVTVFDEVPQGPTTSLIQYEEVPPPGAGDTYIKVGTMPQMLAVTPDTRRVYVPNQQDDTVSVIDTDPASANYNHVIAVVPVGASPYSAAVSPDGTRVYVANAVSDTVSVICVVPA